MRLGSTYKFRIRSRKHSLLVFSCFLVFGFFSVQGQVSLNHWLNYGISANLKSGGSVAVSILDGYDSDFNKSYRQYRFAFAQEVSKQIDFAVYVVNSYAGVSNDIKLKNRYGLMASFDLLKKNKFQSKWSTSFEHHSKNEVRYRQRVINSLNFRLGKYPLFSEVKVALKTTSAIFYNIGGRAISQYSNDGEYAGEFSPNGFHRARFSFKVAFYIGSFQIAPSIMVQREFNTPWAQDNKMNTPDIETGKIRNRFNNYNVIILQFRYTIRSKNIGEERESFETIDN